jgi:hypothetical protein
MANMRDLESSVYLDEAEDIDNASDSGVAPRLALSYPGEPPSLSDLFFDGVKRTPVQKRIATFNLSRLSVKSIIKDLHYPSNVGTVGACRRTGSTSPGKKVHKDKLCNAMDEDSQFLRKDTNLDDQILTSTTNPSGSTDALFASSPDGRDLQSAASTHKESEPCSSNSGNGSGQSVRDGAVECTLTGPKEESNPLTASILSHVGASVPLSVQDRTAAVMELVSSFIHTCFLAKRVLLPKKAPFQANSTPPLEDPFHQLQLSSHNPATIAAKHHISASTLRGVEDAWEAELLSLTELKPKATCRTNSDEPKGSCGSGSFGSPCSPSARSKHRQSKEQRQNMDKRRKDQSESEGEGSPSKRHQHRSNNDEDTQYLLACPYWKYDPTRYSEANYQEKQYRGCSSVYLKDIARVK